MAATTFGQQWAGKVVQFVVDNEGVLEVIRATYSKDLHLMHLIRLLVFFASKYDFWFTATPIPEKLNVAADALSSLYFHTGSSSGSDSQLQYL